MEPSEAPQRPSGVVWTGRVALRSLLALGVLLTVALALAAPVMAQEQPTDVRLTVEAGYDGTYLRGRDVPIRISIDADRLVQATLEVSLEGGASRHAVPVEVPGGSSKDVVVVVPTPLFETGGVEVRLTGDGEAVTAEADLDHLDGGEELVGLLPGVQPPDLPAPQALPVVDGAARFVALDESLLTAAPGSLGPVGTVVAGADELGRLDDASRAGVLTWVARGGHLVIDAQPGANVAGLPDEWQPGDATRVPAARGEIRLTAGAASAGRWDEVVSPTATVAADEVGIGGYTEPVDFAVARDAGIDSLDAPWLVTFLIAYVIAAGPIVWLVLRARRRPAIGWIAVPAVAVVFTAGAFVVGSDLRGATRAAHASIVEVNPGASAVVTTYVGVVSRDGDDARATFPSRWTAGGLDQSAFGGQTRAVSVATTADGPQAGIDLAPGDFAAFSGSGPATFEGMLRVEATADPDGTITGTVHNDTPLDLEEVGVLTGQRGINVGTIAAGASAPFEIASGAGIQDPFAPAATAAWPDVLGWNTGRPDYGSVVNLSAFADVTTRLGPNFGAPGLVTAVGWTRAFDPPAVVAGQPDPSGRTGVMATGVVGAAEGTIPADAVRREIVRGSSATDLPDTEVRAPGGVSGSIWRFTLPPGAAADAALELIVPAWMARADVWDGQAWVSVADRLDQGLDERVFQDPARGEAFGVPAGAVGSGGVVWVRGWQRDDFGIANGVGFALRGAG